MKDFCFYTPTRVVFGRASEEQVGSLVSWYGGHRVLVHRERNYLSFDPDRIRE